MQTESTDLIRMPRRPNLCLQHLLITLQYPTPIPLDLRVKLHHRIERRRARMQLETRQTNHLLE